MDLTQYHRVRTALQLNAAPGAPDDRAAVARTLRYLLMASGLFDEVEVEATDDLDQLVIGLCQFRPDRDGHEVARRVEELWADKVSFPFWEAHTLASQADHVELKAASRKDAAGGYVTVHLVAQKSRIPAQRKPLDQRESVRS